MKKLIVVGASILVVGLLILDSQINVVGYQTVQQSPKNIVLQVEVEIFTGKFVFPSQRQYYGGF
jgi:hypothetical protein